MHTQAVTIDGQRLVTVLLAQPLQVGDEHLAVDGLRVDADLLQPLLLGYSCDD